MLTTHSRTTSALPRHAAHISRRATAPARRRRPSRHHPNSARSFLQALLRDIYDASLDGRDERRFLSARAEMVDSSAAHCWSLVPLRSLLRRQPAWSRASRRAAMMLRRCAHDGRDQRWPAGATILLFHLYRHAHFTAMKLLSTILLR